MHFKRLRLNGFKSFTDPTDMVIEEGLTGIVGPNGCGKSNLLEALRWVMGESSAKSMRGSDMDDVIFAGTDKRPPRPYAEVILTIDNSARLAPAQFNHEDILEISRKITRDMGSVYRVNGKEVRARDLQILFADAATGSNSPALVRQGQISQLIHAKPKQRRVILEEAAGIGGLYSRRHEAEIRLKAASQNLERVDDILKSTETQIFSLRRQAKQAEKYREFSSAIRRSEAVLLAVLYHTITEEKQSAERNLRKTTSEVAEIEIKISEALRLEADLTEKVSPLREEYAIASAVLKRSEIEAVGIEAELSEAENRIKRLERALENITADLARERELAGDAQNVLARVKTELTEMIAQHDDSPEQSAYLQSRVDNGQKELNEAEIRLDQLKAQISELQSRNKNLTENADQARSRKMRLEGDFIQVTTQETQAGAKLEADFGVDILQKAINENIEKNTLTKEMLHKIETELKQLDSEEKDLRQKLIVAETDTHKLSAEIKGLTSLVERPQAKGTGKAISQISVTSGYEKAFGVAFGEDIFFDDDKTGGRYWRMLPFGAEEKPILPNNTQSLKNYVNAPEFLHRALERVAVVHNEDEAILLQSQLASGTSLVSLSGKLWRSDGFVVRDASQTQASMMLEQKNRLMALKQEYEQKNLILTSAKQDYDGVKSKRVTLQTQDTEVRNILKTLEKEYQTLERKIYDLQNARKIAENQLLNITERKKLIERELTEADNILQKALADLDKISGTDHLKIETEKLKDTVTQKRMLLSDMRVMLETHKRSIKEREGRLKTLQKDYEEWQKRFDTAQKRIEDCNKRVTSITKDLIEAKPVPSQILLKKQNVTEKLALATQRHDKAKQASEGLEGELSVLAKSLRDMQNNASKLRETKARLDTTYEGILLREQEIITRMSDKVSATPEDLRHELDVSSEEIDKDSHELEAELKRLNKERDALGAVNLLAEQELTEIEGQSLLLINEKNDLTEAMSKLNATIKDINKEGRERMLRAFDIVNNNFKKLFQHLFSGGVAELQLIESDDPLEAGLEINACPPGKRTSSLSLLSGGEQALTCMALIFAVFLTNPSPICVLDEVDAPLDDSNVERYCNLINEMTKATDTRFLVITHHALTMARTDRLFGVTMAERGVSQLVSVDLKTAEKLVV